MKNIKRLEVNKTYEKGASLNVKKMYTLKQLLKNNIETIEMEFILNDKSRIFMTIKQNDIYSREYKILKVSGLTDKGATRKQKTLFTLGRTEVIKKHIERYFKIIK